MDKASIIKLQKAGYALLRTRDITDGFGRINYAIMQSREFGSWTLLEKFETKTARARRMKEWSEQSNILIDSQ